MPLDWRIQQVAINLQRWRYMPDDLGERHFFVNIPYFHLIARESGKPVMDIRVVVGKPGNNTPIFSEDMETVVFSPYWNIPDTIAENETAPAVARDPNYLARQGIEILRVSSSGTETVNASDVNWDNADAVKGLVFRQKPGAGNALGHVKFLFPNDHNVYLHDTPADALFAKPGRAFSHGCVRVEEPEMLAKYVLKRLSRMGRRVDLRGDARRRREARQVEAEDPRAHHLFHGVGRRERRPAFPARHLRLRSRQRKLISAQLVSRAEAAILKFPRSECISELCCDYRSSARPLWPPRSLVPHAIDASTSVSFARADFDPAAIGGIETDVFEMALDAASCAVRTGAVKNPETLTVIDYSKPSSERRLWVFDLKAARAGL